MLNFKSKNAYPSHVLVAAVMNALIVRFDITYLKWFTILPFLGICIYGITQPWLLILAIIPTFFALEPVPSSIGLGELMLVLLLFLYVFSTYIHEFYTRKFNKLNLLLWGNGIFLVLLLFSCVNALSKGVPISEYIRGLAPFTILYLMIPLCLTLNDEFEFKTKWILISCAVLAVLLNVYINGVFFLEGIYKVYWLSEDGGAKIFNLSNTMDESTLLGPYRDRITMIVQQATSELLPIGLVAFSALAIGARKRSMRIFALVLAIVSLSSILETYTRSMLMSSVLIFMLVGIWMFFLDKKLIKNYIKTLCILIFSGLVFVYSLNIESIWLGRLQVLARAIFHVHENLNDRRGVHKNTDENVSIRLKEYGIAWSIFSDYPLLGAGLGVTHDIAFQRADGESIHQKVGYVHNWIFYWLMVGGLLGLVFYCCLLFIPLKIFITLNSQFTLIKLILVSSVATMSVYACFFAVFRLLTFNLVLALSCGIAFALWHSHYQEPEP